MSSDKKKKEIKEEKEKERDRENVDFEVGVASYFSQLEIEKDLV